MSSPAILLLMIALELHVSLSGWRECDCQRASSCYICHLSSVAITLSLLGVGVSSQSQVVSPPMLMLSAEHHDWSMPASIASIQYLSML